MRYMSERRLITTNKGLKALKLIERKLKHIKKDNSLYLDYTFWRMKPKSISENETEIFFSHLKDHFINFIKNTPTPSVGVQRGQ